MAVYRMQLTEELWEVAYVDQLELLAVDHPDSVDVFVDESFVPPGSLEQDGSRFARCGRSTCRYQPRMSGVETYCRSSPLRMMSMWRVHRPAAIKA